MTRLIDVRYLIFLLAVNNVYAERIKDMIYMSVDDVAACFRRHNGTHQFGCSSTRSGSVGVIHFVEDQSDLKWLEDKGKSGPYTAIMPFSMFTRETTERLEATNNINGILLTKNNSQPLLSSYSPEDTCPNRYSGYKGCDNDTPWNPVGSSFLMKDWPFPIFYLQNETLLEEIRACYFKHNAHDMDYQIERSLCALEMNSFMHSAVNSESCLRRSAMMWNINPTVFCDPLGDRNIHWPVSALTDSTESVILVTARLDSNSMFDGLAPGGNSAITGLVTLLATAYYINSLNATVGKTNVVFSIFNGEAFDYIGSSRVAFDLKQGTFNSIGGQNLGIDRIAAVIELGQLGGVDELFLHANNHKGNSLIEALQKRLSLENSTLDESVPPSSIQSFLSVKSNMTAVVISNHGKQFSNKYYHSILDNAQSLGLDKEGDKDNLAASLAAIAVKLGNLLYQNITGEDPLENEASLLADNAKDLVSQMLSCYLVSANCTLFRAASSPGSSLTDQTYSLYVGVNGRWNRATSLTGQLLVLLTGQQLPNYTSNECNDKRFSWMAGYNFTGLCINSTVNYSIAISPAFTINDYDMKSGKYSTWTESIWSQLSVRMFLKPSAATERLTMVLGSAVGILSFLVVWFVNSRSDLLFDNRRADNC